MSIIITDRQTVIISQALDVDDFEEDLGLDFTPDSVIVRDITYSGSAVPDEEIHAVIVPFIKSRQDLLCSFHDGLYVSNPNTYYNIKKGMDIVNGSVHFKYVDLNAGNIALFSGDGNISITLEFRRHAEQRKENAREYKPKGQRGGDIFPFHNTDRKTHSTAITDPITLAVAPVVKPIMVGSGGVCSSCSNEDLVENVNTVQEFNIPIEKEEQKHEPVEINVADLMAHRGLPSAKHHPQLGDMTELSEQVVESQAENIALHNKRRFQERKNELLRSDIINIDMMPGAVMTDMSELFARDKKKEKRQKKFRLGNPINQ